MKNTLDIDFLFFFNKKEKKKKKKKRTLLTTTCRLKSKVTIVEWLLLFWLAKILYMGCSDEGHN